MAGYNWFEGKSNNAVWAEEEGLVTKSKITAAWLRANGIDEAEVYIYSYSIPARIYEPIEVLKAIDGYEYQCSVESSWDTHPIHLMMQQLRKRVITRIDGYDAAEWLI